MANNNTADVSNVKGVQGGYGFSAATSVTFDITTPFATLGTGFDNMGFISSDGIEEELETDSEDILDLNGDVVFVAKSSEKETLVLTLMSITTRGLSEWYGDAAVDSTDTDYWKITHMAKDHDQRKYVFDLLLKDGRKWRKYVPNGQVTEVGSIVHGAANVAMREVTITCMPDTNGVRMYDFIEKTA